MCRKNFVKLIIYDTQNVSHEFIELCHQDQKYVINDGKVSSFCQKHGIEQINKIKLSLNTHGISFYIKDYTMTDSIYFDSYPETESFIPYMETNHTSIFLQGISIDYLTAKCRSVMLTSCKIKVLEESCDLLSLKSCQVYEIKKTSSASEKNLPWIPHPHTSKNSLPPLGISSDFSRILGYIEEHCREDLKLSTLSEIFHLNTNYLGQLFQKNLHTSFPKYLNIIRVTNASAMLIDSEIPIPEIAELAGYHDDCYFRKVFKAITGETPASYRKRHTRIYLPQLQFI